MSPLLRAGIIAGVVVSAVVYPIAAIGGLGVKSTSETLDALPRELTEVPPAQTTYVYANDGETLLTMFYEEYRTYTPIDEISPYMQQAIIASEDARFYEHNGVDTKGIARAFVANTQAGGVEQGASTLTMQYVRMAMRDGAETPAQVQKATEQTNERKAREATLAMSVENDLTKAEILERYLNRAYFGHRAFGIFAAAEIFFSKRPADLDLGEAAMLAGLVQAPSAYDPASRDRQAATDRRNWVIDRMAALGYISEEIAEREKEGPIALNLTMPRNDCASVPGNHRDWGFFCDMFRSWWVAQPAFGDNPLEREDRLRRGGYHVVTSLDPEIQEISMRHVTAKEGIGSPYAHGAVSIEPGTGLVKAMAINRTYSLDQSANGPHSDPRQRGVVTSNYPNTVNPMLGGGGMAGYQAGSTFKWFVLLAALEEGMALSTRIDSPHRYRSSYPDGGPASCGGYWCPANASGAMTGNHTMWAGMGKSVNTFFVQLQERVGADKAVRMAERLGLRWRTEVDQMMADQAENWGPFTLGVSDTDPLEMANAYAVAAADGVYCEPLPVLSIEDPGGEEVTWENADGDQVEVSAPRCRQEIGQDVARAATDAARCVTGYGAARGSCGSWSTAESVHGMVGRPVAGKTGTTDDNRTAWFIGYTPELSVASFTADPDNPFNAVGFGRADQSIQSASQILRDALAGQPATDFEPPPRSIVR
jgi:membrane peptidoglycan carboxypeptidase